MRPYPAYKDSGVEWIGDVPEHWEVTKVKFLSATSVQYGLNIGAENYIQEGIRFIRTTDIDDLGNLIEDGVYLPERLVEKEYILRDGDFLISRSGTVGRAYVHLSRTHQFSYAGYLVRFTFNEPSIAKFLFYFTKSGVFSVWLESTSVESTIVNVNGQKYANLSIALPVDKAEQHAIAAHLDRKTAQIDALIANKRRRLALLAEERTAIISHAVTRGLDLNAPLKDSGVEWIGEIPVGWEVKKLKFLVSFITSGSRGWAQYYSDEGAVFIRIGNLHRESINLNLQNIQYVCPPDSAEGKRTQVHKDDVLVSITAYIGSIGVVNGDIGEAYVNQHIALTRPLLHQAHSRWLGYCLFSQVGKVQFGALLYGGTKDGLGLDDIQNLLVLVPPLSEQRAIAAYLDQKTAQIDRAIAHTERQIALLQEYRTALISAAVTGKIDVRLGQSFCISSETAPGSNQVQRSTIHDRETGPIFPTREDAQ